MISRILFFGSLSENSEKYIIVDHDVNKVLIDKYISKHEKKLLFPGKTETSLFAAFIKNFFFLSF